MITDYKSYIDAVRFLVDHMHKHDLNRFPGHVIRSAVNHLLDKASNSN